MLQFNHVYNTDCLDGLRDILSDTFDAIITSPPYFMPPYYGQAGLGSSADEYKSNLVARLEASMKTLKQNGVLFLNLGDPTHIRMPWRVVNQIADDGYPYFGEFIWDRGRGHETIFVLGKTDLSKDLINRYVSGILLEDYSHNDLSFPESLVESCLKLLKIQSGNVLDPFMGFGTTGVVARKMGWNFIGFEKKAETCEIANKRIQFIY
jgi:DNA modification methylase